MHLHELTGIFFSFTSVDIIQSKSTKVIVIFQILRQLKWMCLLKCIIACLDFPFSSFNFHTYYNLQTEFFFRCCLLTFRPYAVSVRTFLFCFSKLIQNRTTNTKYEMPSCKPEMGEKLLSKILWLISEKKCHQHCKSKNVKWKQIKFVQIGSSFNLNTMSSSHQVIIYFVGIHFVWVGFVFIFVLRLWKF